mmetsp:Transcript_34166/g.101556  ORF Transcript_34166/g.101556 Transcript_34166/m.101556 type:complete len:274 (-) Transcript_34166:179-1000(-)
MLSRRGGVGQGAVRGRLPQRGRRGRVTKRGPCGGDPHGRVPSAIRESARNRWPRLLPGWPALPLHRPHPATAAAAVRRHRSRRPPRLPERPALQIHRPHPTAAAGAVRGAAWPEPVGGHLQPPAEAQLRVCQHRVELSRHGHLVKVVVVEAIDVEQVDEWVAHGQWRCRRVVLVRNVELVRCVVLVRGHVDWRQGVALLVQEFTVHRVVAAPLLQVFHQLQKFATAQLQRLLLLRRRRRLHVCACGQRQLLLRLPLLLLLRLLRGQRYVAGTR